VERVFPGGAPTTILTRHEWALLRKRWNDVIHSPTVAQARRRQRNEGGAPPKLGGAKVAPGAKPKSKLGGAKGAPGKLGGSKISPGSAKKS